MPFSTASVTNRRTHFERIESALLPTATKQQTSPQFAFGPSADIERGPAECRLWPGMGDRTLRRRLDPCYQRRELIGVVAIQRAAVARRPRDHEVPKHPRAQTMPTSLRRVS